MYHWVVNMRLQAILECFVDDVIRSQNKSKLWTTIALSKFELEKRSKAQNVANWTGYQKFNFQFHIQISKFWQVRNLRLPFHIIFVIESTGVNMAVYFGYKGVDNITHYLSPPRTQMSYSHYNMDILYDIRAVIWGAVITWQPNFIYFVLQPRGPIYSLPGIKVWIRNCN